jgi:acyl-CoA dehydrogenase
VDWAVRENIVKEADRDRLLEALEALYDVIRVDAFDADSIKEMAECSRGKRKVVERG